MQPRPCVHQVIRPRTPWARLEGWGDCTACTADAANERCLGYKPFPGPLPEREPPLPTRQPPPCNGGNS
jgi:hypothetical protein